MKLKLRKLGGYKYTVELPYSRNVDIIRHKSLNHKYMKWTGKVITVKMTYAYDGASGPTLDDKTNLKAALIHDCQYQLMREGLLDRKYRKAVDQTFRRHCIEDGMGKFRAWYYYRAVRMFCKKSSLPRKSPRGQIIEI